MTKLHQFLDYTYAVLCVCCGQKVMDPDKKKGQQILTGKCPVCGGDSKPKKKSKKERKLERRAARNAGCRGKH